jgi:hypothetical protein
MTPRPSNAVTPNLTNKNRRKYDNRSALAKWPSSAKSFAVVTGHCSRTEKHERESCGYRSKAESIVG